MDREGGRIRLDRTAFYPGGGGQPCDLGTLQTAAGTLAVTGVSATAARSGTPWTATRPARTSATRCTASIDWARRHPLMRTHTALHVLCGVIWADYAIPVTGGNMEPMKGRLDFPFPRDVRRPGRAVERRINEEIAKAHEIVVDFVPRSLADADPGADPHRGQPDPAEIDPLRVIDIVGLDRQADGGTHVLSTAEVGGVRVAGTECKGKDNKRIRIEVLDHEARTRMTTTSATT